MIDGKFSRPLVCGQLIVIQKLQQITAQQTQSLMSQEVSGGHMLFKAGL